MGGHGFQASQDQIGLANNGTHFNYLQDKQVQQQLLNESAASHNEDLELYKKSTRKLNAYRAQVQKELHEDEQSHATRETHLDEKDEPILSATDRGPNQDYAERNMFAPD